MNPVRKEVMVAAGVLVHKAVEENQGFRGVLLEQQVQQVQVEGVDFRDHEDSKENLGYKDLMAYVVLLA